MTKDVKLSQLGFSLDAPNDIDALCVGLSKQAIDVLRHSATEAPFCGQFVDNKQDGTYCCALCALPLFSSNAKYNSHTGWPSFHGPVSRDHVAYIEDRTHGMVRTEITCARCQSHLGHVFPDGPLPNGERYCLNSIAMDFVPIASAFSDRLGRGDPQFLSE